MSYCDMCGEPLTGAGSRRASPARPTYGPVPTTPDAPDAPGTRRDTPAQARSDALAREPLSADQAASPASGAARVGSIRIRLNSGKTFDLKGKTAYLIGRRDEVSGIFPDLDLTAFGGYEEGVSRAHVKIHVREDGCFVEDLGSTNETLQNFYRLLPGQLYPLKDGDQLRLGSLMALVILS
jgi:pSer/pThr/pTyr-binding forkhead associated (FHA) protein